jgi:phosphoribosyl-ATP pyrophosphohydrolase
MLPSLVSTRKLLHFGAVGVLSQAMTDSIERLYQAVLAAQSADPATSRTARLFRAGRNKMAKKLAEEAVEVVIDAMHGHADAVVRESADLLYNLIVLWVASGVRPGDVWSEMERRERLLGIAEKLPKRPIEVPRRKVVALERHRARKRR